MNERWHIIDPDDAPVEDTEAASAEGAWHRFTYPALRREAYEADGWRAVVVTVDVDSAPKPDSVPCSDWLGDGNKLRIGNPGERWGRYLCVTEKGGPDCDSAPEWEIVEWMPNLEDGNGFWYRQMFDGEVVGWMTLPALSKSPNDLNSATEARE